MPYWYLVVLVCLIDQAAKFYVQNNFTPFQSSPLFNGWLSLTYVSNYGAAFGIMQSQTLILAMVALAALAYVWLKRREIRFYSLWVQIGIAVALGGALGNCLDRLRQGYVVDFIDLHYWPVFNIADIAILGGVGAVAIGMLIWRRRSKKITTEEKTLAGERENETGPI
jgi:signal peptidase II